MDSPPSGKGRAVYNASVLPDKKEIMSEIQKRIDEFYKQYGKNKPKIANNRCPRRKKKCPYTASGTCQG